MEFKDYLSLINKKKGTIISFVLIFIFLASIFTVVQPFKYGSKAQVLIIQDSVSLDAYTAAKSTEYLSNILAKVISSNSFFENVLNSGYAVSKNYFGQTVKDQMKIWNKTVSAKSNSDSGIISINVYHKDRSQTDLIARAVVYTLQTKHGLYHGGADNVSIKVIDEPITSKYPVKPNLILNFSLALVLGLIFSGIYIYLFPEKKYSVRLMPKFSDRKNKAEDNFYKEPEFAPNVLESVVETTETLPEAEYNFSENLDNTDSNNFNDYDDLDNQEEIAKHGSMNNIFGKPYSDN
jgi:capsular polysaccharide biosynthesis protein